RIAQVVKSLPILTKDQQALAEYLKFKADGPPWTRQVELSLDAGTEGNRMLEIAHKGFALFSDTFLATLNGVMEATGTRSQLRNPALHDRGDVSLHLHVSFYDLPRSRSIEPVARAYKRLLLLRLLKGGAKYDSVLIHGVNRPHFQNLYDRDLSDKHSILRVVSRDHIEIKEHFAPPEVEIAELRRLAALPEAEALRAIDSETRSMLQKNPELVERLGRNAAALRDFEPFIGRERALAFTRRLLEAEAAKPIEGPHQLHVAATLARGPMDAERFAMLERSLASRPEAIRDRHLAAAAINLPKTTERQGAISYYLEHPDRLDLAAANHLFEGRRALELAERVLALSAGSRQLEVLLYALENPAFRRTLPWGAFRRAREAIHRVAEDSLTRGAVDQGLVVATAIRDRIAPGRVRASPHLLQALRVAILSSDAAVADRAIDLVARLYPSEAGLTGRLGDPHLAEFREMSRLYRSSQGLYPAEGVDFWYRLWSPSETTRGWVTFADEATLTAGLRRASGNPEMNLSILPDQPDPDPCVRGSFMVRLLRLIGR
ncbi:MAG TPA: hypothetical protein VM598_04920, partial [Bdellovibrionota bacterium]|nr:hypothetical protein [Bdellovibrionota bacterium]